MRTFGSIRASHLSSAIRNPDSVQAVCVALAWAGVSPKSFDVSWVGCATACRRLEPRRKMLTACSPLNSDRVAVAPLRFTRWWDPDGDSRNEFAVKTTYSCGKLPP